MARPFHLFTWFYSFHFFKELALSRTLKICPSYLKPFLNLAFPLTSKHIQGSCILQWKTGKISFPSNTLQFSFSLTVELTLCSGFCSSVSLSWLCQTLHCPPYCVISWVLLRVYLTPLKLLMMSNSPLGFGDISSCLSGCYFPVSFVDSSFSVDPLNVTYLQGFVFCPFCCWDLHFLYK